MSAQKQCPKCGEKNPAEAVMCWACYTSLTGGGGGATALAGAAGGAIGGPAPMADSGEKKSMDPKLLGIVGVCLLAAVGFGVNTMMSGGGSEDDPLPSGGTVVPDKGGSTQTPVTIPPVVSSGGPNPVSPSAPSQGEIKQASKTPYTMVSAPSLRYAGATVIIVPTQNNVSTSEAKALASVAYTQIMQQKKFSPVEIFVFNDEQSAQLLGGYQSKNRGAPLTTSDYGNPDIASCWKQAVLRQLSDGRKTVYSSPQSNPTNFWASDSKK